MTICACGVVLGRMNKSGKCRPCFTKAMNADPVIQAKRIAASVAYFASPEGKADARAKLARYMENMPEADRQRRADRARELAKTHLARPETKARSLAARLQPEAMALRIRNMMRTRLPWCPEELWPEYRYLTQHKGLEPAEARAILEPQIEGTRAHAQLLIANITVGMQLKQEREREQAY